jgi:hypothetical protein
MKAEIGMRSGTTLLRMLKPDPMPAADRDGQPYPRGKYPIKRPLSRATQSSILRLKEWKSPFGAGRFVSPRSHEAMTSVKRVCTMDVRPQV